MSMYIHRGNEGRYIFVPSEEFVTAKRFYEAAGFTVEII